MLKKTITYEDYNGVERKEDFYFNLSKVELTEMQIGADGGMSEYLQKIVDAKDSATIMEMFKTLILKAYGEKVDDGTNTSNSSNNNNNGKQVLTVSCEPRYCPTCSTCSFNLIVM